MTTATTTAPRYIDAADTAKLVRSALRAAFPGIKFSVRSSRFSLGSAVDVHWTDGPTTGQVDAILARFHGDIEVDGETVTVLPQYITGQRELSADFRALLLDDIVVATGEMVDDRGLIRAFVNHAGDISAAVALDYANDLVHRLSQFVAVTAQREVVRPR